MTDPTSRARRTTTGWLLMAATALALPLGAPAADVIVVEEITQTGLNLLRDKLNSSLNASYAVVGLSSNEGLTSDVKVKILLNTVTMDYTGVSTWLDVCDSVRLTRTSPRGRRPPVRRLTGTPR